MRKVEMRSGLQPWKFRAKSCVAAAVVLLLLFVQTLAASQALHAASCHEDAAAPEHTCAVKTLTQGQVDLAPSSAVTLLPAPLAVDDGMEPVPQVSASIRFLLPSRGPPSLA